MLCKNCGHDITPSEKHCPFCGMESGFPVGMTGDEKIPAVIDAEEILGDVISDVAAGAPVAAPEKPVQNEAEIFDQLNDAAEDNGTVAYVPSDATKKSADSPTVVFSAVSEQAAASTDRYDEDYAEELDDDYSYNNVVAPTDEPDYDDYDEGYATTRGGLTLTNTQIGLISGVAAFIILLVIVILLFTQCGGNDNDVSSDYFGALSSNVATSSNASSLPSSSSELSSDQSSSSGLSEPEEISSQAPSQTPSQASSDTTTSNTTTSDDTTSNDTTSNTTTRDDTTPETSETPTESAT